MIAVSKAAQIYHASHCSLNLNSINSFTINDLNIDLNEAYKAWSEIYEKLEGVNYMFELHRAMGLFSNEEVYGITDYGKKLNGYA